MFANVVQTFFGLTSMWITTTLLAGSAASFAAIVTTGSSAAIVGALFFAPLLTIWTAHLLDAIRS